ncbi:MAG: FKBP-type peptidyl-prolyl cis-trans isomerase [Planctomycetes bacterium]|nr:FKBP-type peptidyl-prolyl cis-trans isomerase [Planctomycetota bacterium]
MKVKLFLGLGAVLVCLVGIVLAVDGGATPQTAAGTAPAKVALATDGDKTSYAVGVAMTQSLKGAELNIDALCQGVRDQLGGKPLALPDEEIGTILQAFSAKMRAIQGVEREKMMEANKVDAVKNKQIGADFLAENAKKEGIKTTASGLQYLIIEQGKGKKPGPADSVKVHYKGTFIDGKEFDSSYKRNEPAVFPLNGVIKGWTEGLQLLNEGGKATLFVPGDLAYGDNGRPGIPPASMLIFEVELLEVTPAPEK